MAPSDFISQFSFTAIKACMFGPYSPGAMLGEAAQESGWGSSALCLNSNNYFGIKADSSWTGATDSTGVYRAYDTSDASFADRNAFLTAMPRYSAVTAAPDADSQIAAIAAAGYAEDPNYASEIQAIIDSNGLSDLDQKKNSTRYSRFSPSRYVCSLSCTFLSRGLANKTMINYQLSI